MPKSITNLVPEQWRELLEFLAAPISWIPGMQQWLLEFVFGAPSGWIAGAYFILLLFPVLLWVGGVWCTQLALYTVPFRSGRIEFIKLILLAWWDAALAVWTYWVGLARFFVVIGGWILTLARLALKFIVEFGFLDTPFGQPTQLAKERAHEPSWPAGSRINPIARANACHFDCSAKSCFRPSAVRR